MGLNRQMRITALVLVHLRRRRPLTMMPGACLGRKARIVEDDPMRWNVSRAAVIMFGSLALCVPPARATALFGTESFAEAFARCVGDSRQPILGPTTSATSAAESGTPSDPTTCNPGDTAFGEAMESSASASAGLGPGTLRAFAEAVSSSPNFPTQLASGDGFGMFFDNLTIIPSASAGDSGNFAILGITIHGFQAQNAEIQAGIWLNGGIPDTTVPGVSDSNQCITTEDSGGSGDCDFTLQLTMPLSIFTPTTIAFNMNLIASASNNGLADASSTGQAFLILPPGFTSESASGVFLTQEPGSVPEPASIVLLSLGLMALVWMNRRVLTRDQ
jgi:hypothetical protein